MNRQRWLVQNESRKLGVTKKGDRALTSDLDLFDRMRASVSLRDLDGRPGSLQDGVSPLRRPGGERSALLEAQLPLRRVAHLHLQLHVVGQTETQLVFDLFVGVGLDTVELQLQNQVGPRWQSGQHSLGRLRVEYILKMEGGCNISETRMI